MKKIILFLTVMLFTSVSLAEGIAWNQHQGAFGEINAGTLAYFLGVASSKGKTSGGGVVGASIGGTLGYNMTSSFGLEGGVLAGIVNINNGGQIYAPYFSTRFNVPMGDRASLLFKLGATVPFIPHKVSILLPFAGIGATYAVTERVDLGLQYQGAVYGIINAGALGLSLTYHF